MTGAFQLSDRRPSGVHHGHRGAGCRARVTLRELELPRERFLRQVTVAHSITSPARLLTVAESHRGVTHDAFTLATIQK